MFQSRETNLGEKLGQKYSSFLKEELEILKFWSQNNVIQKQKERSQNKPRFVFYDGPPFANGLPHFGHILVSVIKDVVCRFASQTGNAVQGKIGWDCHGLPIQYQVNKQHQINAKNQVLQMGIGKYNDLCNSLTMKYIAEWQNVLKRFGRWTNFSSGYRTSESTYMQSVWQVFKKLYDNRLIYKDAKVLPYSTALHTPLSKMQVQLNYKQKCSCYAWVAFCIVKSEAKLVVWTREIWTLVGNLAILVNIDWSYVKIKHLTTNQIYILAESRLSTLFRNKQVQEYEVVRQLGLSMSLSLAIMKIEGKRGVLEFFQAILWTKIKGLVSSTVVQALIKHITICACRLKLSNQMTALFPQIKKQDLLLKSNNLEDWMHLLLKLQFQNHQIAQIKLFPQGLKDMPILTAGEATNLYSTNSHKPGSSKSPNQNKKYSKTTLSQNGTLKIQNKTSSQNPQKIVRMLGVLVGIDFGVIRSRYGFRKTGSIRQLEEMTGCKITDLHRENIDHLTVQSKKGKGKLKRIQQVFDCWFESGSMPFSQSQNTSISPQNQQQFPADFIAEGVDQIRGWFYVLNVVAAGLNRTTPFKNAIVNGLVLKDDGRCWRKYNHADPMDICGKYGADAVRVYLLDSRVVAGQNVVFSEAGVEHSLKFVLTPWRQIYQFMMRTITEMEARIGDSFIFIEDLQKIDQQFDILDRWILSELNTLVAQICEEMRNYRLDRIIRLFIQIIWNIKNWYFQLNRNHFRLYTSDIKIKFNVLFEVYFKVNILMSPFIPFITQFCYQNLKKYIRSTSIYQEDSIHLVQIPKPINFMMIPELSKLVQKMKNIIESSKALREKKKIDRNTQIMSVRIITSDLQLQNKLTSLIPYIYEQVNVRQIKFGYNYDENITLTCVPNLPVLGPRMRFNNDFGEIRRKITQLTTPEIRNLQQQLRIKIVATQINITDIIINTKCREPSNQYQAIKFVEEGLIVLADTRSAIKLTQPQQNQMGELLDKDLS